MIQPRDLSPVVAKWYFDIYREIKLNMESYNLSGMHRRDPFTRVLFKWLDMAFGYKSNPHGSIHPSKTQRVLEKEGGRWKWGLDFGYILIDFLERLELGFVDFRWIWEKFLRDAVREEWFEDLWKPELGSKDFNILKKGPLKTTPARPYVGNVMRNNSDAYAYSINKAISNTIRGKGYSLEVKLK